MGFRSMKPENAAKPIEPDTVLAMTSCTKLMTTIALLQCLERGIFDLDEDVGRISPELKNVEIISDPEGASDTPTLKPKKTPITLRLLLTHSSGSCYDLMSPLLVKWQTDRGEAPWSAATIETRCNSSLVFEPGTSWRYGMRAEWAGKMIERATVETFEIYTCPKTYGSLFI